MAEFVVDASALAKLFLDEPESKAFRTWYLAQIQLGAVFAAPGLLGYEVAHLMARNLDVPAKPKDWFAVRHDEALEGIVLHHQIARLIQPFARKLTGYDASYIALAVAEGAALVSYDRVLVREAGAHGVATVSPS